MQPLEIIISAPGKVLLHGEHAVVYDKLAIASTLDLRTSAKMVAKPHNDVISIHLTNLNTHVNINFAEMQKQLFASMPLRDDVSEFNWCEPNLIDTEKFLLMIEQFLGEHDFYGLVKREQLLAIVIFCFLYVGITQSIDIELEPFELQATTNLSVGAGTGSSASFCVSLAACFMQYVRVKLLKQGTRPWFKSQFKQSPSYDYSLTRFNSNDLALINAWALCGEQVVHGIASGVDTAICTYGSFIKYRRSAFLEPIKGIKPLRLLLVNTKVSRDTKTLVRSVAAFRQKHQKVVDHILNAIDSISIEALKCLLALSEFEMSQKNMLTNGLDKNDSTKTNGTVNKKNSDSNQNEFNGGHFPDGCSSDMFYDKIMDLITLNQQLLTSLGVSHPTIDDICQIAARHKLAAKLTGAGGGGFVMIIVPTSVTLERELLLINDLTSAGYEVLKTKMGVPGVTINKAS